VSCYMSSCLLLMNVVTELTIALFMPPLTQQTRTSQMNHKDLRTGVLGMNDPDFVFLSIHGCSTGHLTTSTILAERGKSSSLLTPTIIPFLSFGKHFVDVLYQYTPSIYQAHVFPRLRGSGRSVWPFAHDSEPSLGGSRVTHRFQTICRLPAPTEPVQSIPNSTSLMTLLVGYLVYKVRLALNACGSVITGRRNNSRTAKTFPTQVENRVLSRCYGPQWMFQSHLQTITSLFLNDGDSRQFFGVLKPKFAVQ
jgi:hypothetical protein